MDCTLIVPVTVTKFSHVALKALIAALLGVTPGEVGISCNWRENEKPPAVPAECTVLNVSCDALPNDLWSAYAPLEDDVQEHERKIKEEKYNDPVVKELLKRIEDLEKSVKDSK